MLDQDKTHANDRPSTLDRVWAATRPPELSPDEFDRIWADVQRAHDRPATLPMIAPARPSRRPIVLVSLFLAQAAAVFLAVCVLPRPAGKEKESGRNLLVQADPFEAAPKPVRRDFEVETDETLVLRIGDGPVELIRLKHGQTDAMAFNGDVPPDNHNDMLNWAEAHSR